MILTGAPVFTPIFNPNQAVLSLVLPLRLRSEVVFGTPSKNCSGNGICMLTQHRTSSLLTGPCPKEECWIRINTATEEVFLEFDSNTLSGAALQKHFAASCFYMEEAVRIPLSISKKWKIRGVISLNSGSYPIIKEGDKIILVLKYSAANFH